MKAAAVLSWLLVLALVVAVVLSFTKGFPELDVEFGEAQRETVRVDSIYLTRVDTVTKYQRRVDTVRAASDALDSAVLIVNDSTVHLQLSNSSDSASYNLTVSPVIVADLRALRTTVATQDTLIAALYGKDTTWQWRFDTHQKMHRLDVQRANGPRWGIGFTLGYGCGVMQCGPTANVGVTYSAKLPNLKQLFFHMVK